MADNDQPPGTDVAQQAISNSSNYDAALLQYAMEDGFSSPLSSPSASPPYDFYGQEVATPPGAAVEVSSPLTPPPILFSQDAPTLPKVAEDGSSPPSPLSPLSSPKPRLIIRLRYRGTPLSEAYSTAIINEVNF